MGHSPLMVRMWVALSYGHSPLMMSKKIWQFNSPAVSTLHRFPSMKYKRMKGSWRHAPKLQKAAEAGQCVAGLDSLQESPKRPLHEGGEVKAELQRRSQDVVNVRTMGHLLRDATVTMWTQPKRKSVCLR